MAEFFGLAVGSSGLFSVVLGFIALFRPIPSLRISSRGRAALLLAGGLVLIVVGGSLVPDDKSAATKEANGDQPSDGKAATSPTIGQPIDHDGYRVVVTRVLERRTVGDELVSEAAASGGVLVVVEYTIENRSNHPIGAFAFPTPVLIDANGVIYKPDIGKTGTYTMEANFDRKLMSDLNPGIQVRDADVFEVSHQAFDRATWQLGLDDARVSLKEAANPPSTTSSAAISRCATATPTAERLMCENPELRERNNRVSDRLVAFFKHHPRDPRRKQFDDGAVALFRTCDTVDCVERWTEQWEVTADQWGA